MRRVSAESFKRIALDILIDFDRVCRQNNIKYSIAYGTLLGAVRHKGYIPWDDDIDVIMLREEYEKFLKMKDGLSSNHRLVSVETESEFTAPLPKIIDTNTILKEIKHRQCIDIGVYIDIFIFDYIPKGRFLKGLFYCRSYVVKKIWGLSTYYEKTNLFLERKIRQWAANKKIGRKAVCLLNRKLRKEKKSDFVCSLMFSVYGWSKVTFPTSLLQDVKDIKFENYTFYAFFDFDFFLKSWYGDYMKLPPVEERKIQHNYLVYYKDEKTENREQKADEILF